MELDKILDKIKDEIELDLGEDAGKLKGAELKSYIKAKLNDITARDTQLQTTNQELQNWRKQATDASALLAAAANMPIDDGRGAPAAVVDDDGFGTYEKDPLLGDFAKKFKGRFSKEVREELLGELKPLIDRIAGETGQITRFALLDRNQRDFKDAGEWPEGWDYKKAQEYAKDKGYWLPGGQQYGMVDVGRVHSEVTEPIRRSRFEEDVRKNAREEAIKALRAEGATISIPQRSMGGGPKPVQVKGRNGEEILSNALNQAAADQETMRMLDGLRG